jgi:BirA family biotin operon repressor/biotin-[acetyl-CoA-carboxylase] ligase
MFQPDYLSDIRVPLALRVADVPVKRDAFASALAACWAEDLVLWHGGGWPVLREAWLARGLPRGTLLGVNLTEEGHVIGGFAGLELDGAVLLRLADGAVRAIHAGDVELIGPR